MLPQKLVAPLVLCALYCASAFGDFEVFAKGSVAKNYLASDSYTVDVSGSAGFAFSLFSGVRFEARYTNITEFQNKMDVVSTGAVGTLNNMLSETDMITAGIDIDFFGEKSFFQPYIYLGAGYVVTQRSYYFTSANGGSSTYGADPNQEGISGNVGLGIRLRIARRLAIELEMFAYGLDITQPNPLINWFGSAGLRIFI